MIGSTVHVSQWLPSPHYCWCPTGHQAWTNSFYNNDKWCRVSSSKDWKYVHDLTFSDVVQNNISTESQSIPGKVNSWAYSNDMRMNPSKRKELIINFSHAYELPPVLRIDGTPLDRVECHKVLGRTLQSNLKWNIFIEHITSKASKRLHILRVLT